MDVLLRLLDNAQNYFVASYAVHVLRYVLLAGSSKSFTVDPAHFMRKEAEIMSSRYATRQEVLDSLELVARGELWPLVNEKAPLEQAEAIHQRLDKGLVTGRAALIIT